MGSTFMPRYLEALGYGTGEIMRFLVWPPFIAAITALLTGCLSHRVGSRRMLIAGILIVAVTLAAASLTKNASWATFLLLARVSGSSMIAVASMLLMVENSEGQARMRLFCFRVGLFALAQLFTPAVGMEILDLSSQPLNAHRIMAGVLGAVLILSLLPLSRIRTSDAAREQRRRWQAEELLQSPLRLVRLFLPLALVGLVGTMLTSQSFVLMTAWFDASTRSVKMAYAWIPFSVAILAFLTPRLARAMGTARLTLLLYVLALLGIGMMGFASTFGWSMTGFCAQSILRGIAAPLFMVIIFNRVPKGQWGIAAAMLTFSWPDSLIAPTLGSILRASWGNDAIIIFAMTATLLAVVLFGWFVARTRASTQVDAPVRP